MDYSFSAEQDEFRGLMQSFAREKVAPYAEEWDEKGQFPLDTVLELGRLGAFGITFPEESLRWPVSIS